MPQKDPKRRNKDFWKMQKTDNKKSELQTESLRVATHFCQFLPLVTKM
jgi:hypothetical protein